MEGGAVLQNIGEDIFKLTSWPVLGSPLPH